MSEGECPLEEWVGLDTFLFCGATGRSADPDGSVTGSRQTNRPLSNSIVHRTQIQDITRDSKKTYCDSNLAIPRIN